MADRTHIVGKYRMSELQRSNFAHLRDRRPLGANSLRSLHRFGFAIKDPILGWRCDPMVLAAFNARYGEVR